MHGSFNEEPFPSVHPVWLCGMATPQSPMCPLQPGVWDQLHPPNAVLGCSWAGQGLHGGLRRRACPGPVGCRAVWKELC